VRAGNLDGFRALRLMVPSRPPSRLSSAPTATTCGLRTARKLEAKEPHGGCGQCHTVWAVTDDPGAAACPDCGTVSGRVHEYLLTRPRDRRRGREEVSVCWLKRRWTCISQERWRQTFTGSLPALDAGTGTALPP
jgi:hypothetical protein